MRLQKNNPGAKPGNQNAAKTDAERLSSTITARCLPADKAAWVKAAQDEGIKLTDWINRTLNEKARSRQ
jgi:predicted HicB family RNase H-like nuclease